jgi:holo-[acyl-carrier protein] synthase
MIAGIGIDAVEINRLEKWMENPEMLKRVFAEEEIALCRKRGASMLRSLAARFAAKEAFGKALGTGLAGFALTDIIVKGEAGEAPVLGLSGKARDRMREQGAKAAHISLTHEGNIAIAVVILEKQ